MKIFLVIPTNRGLGLLSAWGNQFDNCHLIIIGDHWQKNINLPRNRYQSLNYYSWQDINKDFGKDEWIFPRQNAGIRSYGFWKAYQMGADVIITLDDDCYPVDNNFVAQHLDNLSLSAPKKWITTYPHPGFMFTRGIPYLIRNKYPVMISHGLWTNKIDLDAQTQLKHPDINLPPYPPMLQFIPKGAYFPMCSMNLAFRREITPLMYFPLMGKDPRGQPWGYDRFDDIWAGIFAKKICDHLGFGMVSGSPFVEHRKASDPYNNLEKEKSGIKTNETLWKIVDKVKLTQKTPISCYLELIGKVRFSNENYFKSLRQAMVLWAQSY